MAGRRILYHHLESHHIAQVCGGDLTDRLCSKICLAKVYPNGCHTKAVKLYAIIHDQSNRSMAHSEFFEMFGIHSPSLPYSLKTCAGIMETTSSRVHKVRKTLNGPHELPFTQKRDLGWVIVSNVCLGNVHKPITISTLYTKILDNGRSLNHALMTCR